MKRRELEGKEKVCVVEVTQALCVFLFVQTLRFRTEKDLRNQPSSPMTSGTVITVQQTGRWQTSQLLMLCANWDTGPAADTATCPSCRQGASILPAMPCWGLTLTHPDLTGLACSLGIRTVESSGG